MALIACQLLPPEYSIIKNSNIRCYFLKLRYSVTFFFGQKPKHIVLFRAHREVLIQKALCYDRINKGRVVYFFLFLLLVLDLPLLLLHALIFYVIYCSHLPKKSMTAIIQCHCNVVFCKYYLQFIVIVLL